MTTLNDQLNELVKVTLEEKQALTDGKNNIQLKWTNQQKAPISFVIVSLTNQSVSTLQLE